MSGLGQHSFVLVSWLLSLPCLYAVSRFWFLFQVTSAWDSKCDILEFFLCRVQGKRMQSAVASKSRVCHQPLGASWGHSLSLFRAPCASHQNGSNKIIFGRRQGRNAQLTAHLENLGRKARCFESSWVAGDLALAQNHMYEPPELCVRARLFCARELLYTLAYRPHEGICRHAIV